MTENTREERGERVVRCPVEGCTAEKLARGMHLHILRSAGDGHGDQDEYPGGVTRDNLTEVGREEVEVDYPSDRESESVARLCPYCRQPFSGKEGVMIHLGQVAGRKNHPENGSEIHDPTDFPAVKLDADENIIAVAGDQRGCDFEGGGIPSVKQGQESFVPLTASEVSRLYRDLCDADR
jgi:hypothetical protein